MATLPGSFRASGSGDRGGQIPHTASARVNFVSGGIVPTPKDRAAPSIRGTSVALECIDGDASVPVEAISGDASVATEVDVVDASVATDLAAPGMRGTSVALDCMSGAASVAADETRGEASVATDREATASPPTPRDRVAPSIAGTSVAE